MPPMLFPHICVLGSVHPFYSFQLQNQSPCEASTRRGFHSSQKLVFPTLDVPFPHPLKFPPESSGFSRVRLERRAQGGTGGPLKTHHAPRSFVLRACSAIQSCPTLCDPMDCSPPGSSVHGVLQARIGEKVAIPPPGDLPNPGIEPSFLCFLHWQAGSLPLAPAGKPKAVYITSYQLSCCF